MARKLRQQTQSLGRRLLWCRASQTLLTNARRQYKERQVDAMHTRPDVVVIEDDAAIRELIVEVLREEGYLAVGLLGGANATPLLAEAPPRLILLDRHLGDCDAQQVLAALRMAPFLASIPVVLMSASATVYQEAAALGTAGALAKPFQLEDLAACVATWIAQPPPA